MSPAQEEVANRSFGEERFSSLWSNAKGDAEEPRGDAEEPRGDAEEPWTGFIFLDVLERIFLLSVLVSGVTAGKLHVTRM